MDRLHSLAKTVTLVVGTSKRNEATLCKHASIPDALCIVLTLNRCNLWSTSGASNRKVSKREEAFFELSHVLHIPGYGVISPYDLWGLLRAIFPADKPLSQRRLS
jgi:hypothetical protein